MTAGRTLAAVLLCAAFACGVRDTTPPAPWEPGVHQCAFCRMTVIDRGFASQIVAPDDEPNFFDDMGCLANYLAKQTTPVARAVVYVADRRTGEWVPAADAVYTRVDTLRAPMGSHIVAHRSADSRAGDAESATGIAVAIRDVFPAGLPVVQP